MVLHVSDFVKDIPISDEVCLNWGFGYYIFKSVFQI